MTYQWPYYRLRLEFCLWMVVTEQMLVWIDVPKLGVVLW